MKSTWIIQNICHIPFADFAIKGNNGLIQRLTSLLYRMCYTSHLSTDNALYFLDNLPASDIEFVIINLCMHILYSYFVFHSIQNWRCNTFTNRRRFNQLCNNIPWTDASVSFATLQVSDAIFPSSLPSQNLLTGSLRLNNVFASRHYSKRKDNPCNLYKLIIDCIIN